MKTTATFIDAVQKAGQSCMTLMLCAVAAAIMLAAPAPASATTTVPESLWASVSDIRDAAIKAGANNQTNTLLAILAADEHLDAAKSALASQSALDPIKFGKKIDAEAKKVQKLYDTLSNGNWNSAAAVKKIASEAHSMQKLATLSGEMPLLMELNAKTAGFHKGWEQVLMSFDIPEGTTGCQLYCPANGGVIASVLPDYVNGTALVTMGSTQGGSYCELINCSPAPTNAPRWLLYNYGGKELPAEAQGAPVNVPSGKYRLTYSATGIGSNIFLKDISLPAGDMYKFYTTFIGKMNAIVHSISVPGCTQSFSWSPYNNGSFSCTLNVQCCSNSVCASVGVIFTFTKIA